MGERGVEVFSISDHDALGAYGAFTPANGARVVTGIEINTTYRHNEVHILGYGMHADSPVLLAMIERNCNARRERVERMVAQLRRAGYGITMDDVLVQAGHAKALGRPHVAKALIAAGISSDVSAAFRNLLRGGKAGYVPSTHVNPHDAISAIRAADGVAVLAHPGRLKDRAIIDELALHDLDGLEVFYPLHDADDVIQFRRKAAEYGLVMTAGSDFHDLRYHTQGVGMEVDLDDIAPFLERVHSL